MKIVLLIFSLLLFLVTKSFGQSDLKLFSIKVWFAPAFMYGCTVKINCKDNAATICLISNKLKSKPQFTDSAVANGDQILMLRKFLKDSLKVVDTIKYIKAADGSDTKMHDIKSGLDGIMVTGIVTTGIQNRGFEFWSPRRNSSNARLISKIFDILNNAFVAEDTVDYLEQLREYFPHQLGLKKLSDKPLRYKLYGTITSDEQDQLDKFFYQLPKNGKVEIDMSNFSGMGIMFYSVIEEHLSTHGNVYWINPSYRGLIDLYKIGAPNNHIKSEKIISKIETVNGKELITTIEY